MGLSKGLDADKKKQGRGHTHLFSASLSQGEDMDLCFHVACLCIFEQPHTSLFVVPLGDPFGPSGIKTPEKLQCLLEGKIFCKSPLAISSGEKLEELHD